MQNFHPDNYRKFRLNPPFSSCVCVHVRCSSDLFAFSGAHAFLLCSRVFTPRTGRRRISRRSPTSHLCASSALSNATTARRHGSDTFGWKDNHCHPEKLLCSPFFLTSANESLNMWIGSISTKNVLLFHEAEIRRIVSLTRVLFPHPDRV